MKKLRRSLPNDKLVREASRYGTRTEFARRDASAYAAARKRGILDIVCSHMPRRKERKIQLTVENMQKKALKCKNKSEFRRKYPSAYVKAYALKIVDSICSHMPADLRSERKPYNFKWPKEKLQILFLKFKSKRELREEYEGAYQAAQTNGWLEELTLHMHKSRNASGAEKELYSIIKLHYPSTKKLRDYRVKIENKSYIRRLELDIFVPERLRGIEFDGKYWHSFKIMRQDKRKREWTDEDIRNYNSIKDTYFRDGYGVTVLHIKEEDWIKDKEVCINKCLEFLRN